MLSMQTARSSFCLGFLSLEILFCLFCKIENNRDIQRVLKEPNMTKYETLTQVPNYNARLKETAGKLKQ